MNQDPLASIRAMIREPTVVESAWFDSPLGTASSGTLRLDASERGVCRVEFGASGAPARRPRPAHAALCLALDELREFFAGRVRRSRVPRDLSCGTGFERAVWETLAREVGPGELVTYGVLAARAGYPGAARAVGAAMGKNRIPIFVPCHRVIAAGARPGGFGFGLAAKHALLACEGCVLPGWDAS